jgi:hypothetical protein
MSISKDIIEQLKMELDSKTTQREVILDQLQILDVLLDKYDVLIENMDREVLKLTRPINDAAREVRNAYDARIKDKCRTDLVWKKTGSIRVNNLGAGGFTTVDTYEVVKNKSTEDFTPFDGIKFYQKPSNRDYGSTIVSEFIGNVSQGSSIIAINVPDQNVINVFSDIQIGDTVTDDLSSPKIFSLGSLPEILGTGTTDSIGIVTTLVGGIFNGGTTFFQFGAGVLDDVELGMILIGPEVASETGELEPVLQENTTIVGFGTGDYPVEYFDDEGTLTNSVVLCDTITIDKPSLRALDEGEFTVGIVTTFPALFITTSANQTAIGASFTVIRTADRDNLDADFDPLSSPNSPIKIGDISSKNLGVGSSAFYDFSGNPSEIQTWNPASARDEIVDIKGNIILEEIKEPKVGAGAAVYNKGTTQWPVINTPSVGGGLQSSYASLGTKTRASLLSISVGYVSQPPGGFPSNCSALNSDVSQAEANYSELVSKNRSSAKEIAGQTIALRTERSKKETMAWSLLQASSSLREDIRKLRKTLRELDRVNFSLYEKR